MIYREHYIELFVNGQAVEFESQKDVSIRFNNVLQDPTKISYTQAEYSFSFDLPCSPTNNKIFDHANVLSKPNKFRSRYNAELYADGTLIFKGSLTIASIKNKKYNVNLVSVKTYSLEDIFGDTTMNQIRPMKRDASGNIERDENGKPIHTNWEIPFDGAPTINAINFEGNTEVMFPLISYGAFAKQTVPASATLPQTRTIYYGDYTSKFDLDNYNQWYIETFYPSHNLLATLKNAFETKDYIVQGDIFQNDWLKDVYMSVNLADEQVPTYNLANPKFGKVDLNVRWVCPQDVAPSGVGQSGTSYGTTSTLKFPCIPTARPLIVGGSDGYRPELKYNCEQVRVYDMMLQDDGGTATTPSNSYLYQSDEGIVVIPADGFYKINMQVSARLNQTNNITAGQYTRIGTSGDDAEEPQFRDITFAPDFKICCPLEIQLVKNWLRSDDDGIELIKGTNGIIIYRGQNDLTGDSSFIGKYENTSNCYPHDKIGYNLYMSQPSSSIEPIAPESIQERQSMMGIMPLACPMAFDPIVSDKFVCGFSSWGNKYSGSCGTGAVIKNGASWTKMGADKKNESFFNCTYGNPLPINGGTMLINTNKNSYVGAQYSFNQTTNTITGTIQCMVRFNRNDVLRLVAVHRDYETTGAVKVSYATSATCQLTIEAASPKTAADIRSRMTQGKYNYSSPSEFEYNLNLANFFNNETQISDWVKNVQDAFNLEILQDANVVTINSKKRPILKPSAVDLDDRVNSNEAEAKPINYPKSMAVKYKIDEDEWGAERSAIEKYGDDSIMNSDDWKDWIDRGYDVIELNDDTFVTSKSEKSLRFAYTWYDEFEWIKSVNQSEGLKFRMPVISKFQYMVDGYDYEESRKHDGYGLSQRFWFKPHMVEGTYTDANYQQVTSPIDLDIKAMNETVRVYVPQNYKDNFNLSYKTSEKCILSEFFNIQSYLASNYVKIDVYLSPQEYYRLKNGANVHFDSDIYEVVQIDGYDSSGYNPTTLTLLKKVV